MSHSDLQPLAVHTVQSATAWVWPSQGMKNGHFKGTSPLFHPAHLWVQLMSVPSLPIEEIEFYRYSCSRCSCSHEGVWDRVYGLSYKSMKSVLHCKGNFVQTASATTASAVAHHWGTLCLFGLFRSGRECR